MKINCCIAFLVVILYNSLALMAAAGNQQRILAFAVFISWAMTEASLLWAHHTILLYGLVRLCHLEICRVSTTLIGLFWLALCHTPCSYFWYSQTYWEKDYRSIWKSKRRGQQRNLSASRWPNRRWRRSSNGRSRMSDQWNWLSNWLWRLPCGGTQWQMYKFYVRKRRLPSWSLPERQGSCC